MTTFFIAADPGKNGALVCLRDDGAILGKMATPVDESDTVSVKDEIDFIMDMCRKGPERVVFIIEDVHPLYAVSAKSTGTFMYNKGELHGIFETIRCIASKIEMDVEFLAPKTWQKEVWNHADKVFQGGKIDTKKTSLKCAERLFPDTDFRKNSKCKTPHDGIVDAVLIAEAGRRLFKND